MRIRFFAPVQIPTETPVKRVNEESINDDASDFGSCMDQDDSTMSIDEASFESSEEAMTLPEMNDH